MAPMHSTLFASVARRARRVAQTRCASYLAAIDQGTSSSRVILYDAGSLAPVASHQVELQSCTTNPQPGWSQMDPLGILASVEASAAGALDKAGAKASDVVGVGITNQRESTVVWDKRTGAPLHDCILWHDARTSDVSRRLQAELGGLDALRGSCGLPISTYFSGVKLRWLLDEVPDVKAGFDNGHALFGTVDAWLLWNLTGGPDGGRHATDFTNASRTMLMDLDAGAWDADNATKLGVASAVGGLPEIVSSAEPYGAIAAGALAGCPVTGILGDQQSAMVGQRCFDPGDAKITYGTGAFLLMNAGETPVASTHGLLSTALYQFGSGGPRRYALEGAVACCAVGINWFRDALGMFEEAPEISALAASVDSAEGVCFVSAFGGLLAPRWRDDARGALVGLTLAHDKRHVARAVLEGIAHQSADVVQAMVADSGNALTTLKVDGGVALSDELLQAQADIAGAAVYRPADVETTAAGAAVAAGIGAGVFDGPAALADDDGAGAKFAPAIGADERAARVAAWNKAVEASLGWA